MQIYCRLCASEIPSRHLNLKNKRAKCPACNAVFDISGELEQWERESRLSPIRLPKNMTIAIEGADLIIKRRWFTWQELFVGLAGVVVVDGMSIVWYILGFSVKVYWPMVFIFTFFALLGIGYTYYFIATMFNTTIIRTNNDKIQIQHRPIPIPWLEVELLTLHVQQLLCKFRVTQSRGGRSVSYELYALTVQNQEKLLVEGLENPEEVLFMEQEMERYLGIPNERVQGELPKSG